MHGRRRWPIATPRFPQRALADAEMAPIRDALARLLEAHDPAPTFVLDDAWNLLQANRGIARLLHLLGLDLAALPAPPNLLRAMLVPGGLGDRLINADEVVVEVWQRAQREALASPPLRAIVEAPRPSMLRRWSQAAYGGGAPLLLIRMRAMDGRELTFFSAFTTFGAPLDVTAASLRVEHFFPSDEATRATLAEAS